MRNKSAALNIVFLIIIACLIGIIICLHTSTIQKETPDALENYGQYEEYHPNYRLIDISEGVSGSEYYYEIGREAKILAQGTHAGVTAITALDSNLVRLLLGGGTNNKTIQYFDVYSDRISAAFFVPSGYADYCDENGNYLVAFFDYSDGGNEKTVLKIRNVFDEGFNTEIEREFISPITGANKLIFLNKNEIYLDYDVFIDERNSERRTVKEIVDFTEKPLESDGGLSAASSAYCAPTQEDNTDNYKFFGTWSLDKVALIPEWYSDDITKNGYIIPFDSEDYLGYEIEYTSDFFRLGEEKFFNPTYTISTIEVNNFNEYYKIQRTYPDIYHLIENEGIKIDKADEYEYIGSVPLLLFSVEFEEDPYFEKYFIPVGDQCILLNKYTMLVGIDGKVILAHRVA